MVPLSVFSAQLLILLLEAIVVPHLFGYLPNTTLLVKDYTGLERKCCFYEVYVCVCVSLVLAVDGR